MAFVQQRTTMRCRWTPSRPLAHESYRSPRLRASACKRTHRLVTIRCTSRDVKSEDVHDKPKMDWSRAKPLLHEMRASYRAGGLAPPWTKTPETVSARKRLSVACSSLAALAVYGDETKTFEEDVDFYRQGSDLFARDFKRDFPLLRADLLGTITGEKRPVLTSGEQARIRRLRADLLALVPFAFICINTVPLTPAIMPTILRYVPRKWVLPSSFEEARLRPMQRLVASRRTKIAQGYMNKKLRG